MSTLPHQEPERRPWTAVLPAVAALLMMIGLAWLILGFLTWRHRERAAQEESRQSVTETSNDGPSPENRPGIR
jgi:ferric-dicitrate binding protein FerR (iron transport regulator)